MYIVCHEGRGKEWGEVEFFSPISLALTYRYVCVCVCVFFTELDFFCKGLPQDPRGALSPPLLGFSSLVSHVSPQGRKHPPPGPGGGKLVKSKSSVMNTFYPPGRDGGSFLSFPSPTSIIHSLRFPLSYPYPLPPGGGGETR